MRKEIIICDKCRGEFTEGGDSIRLSERAAKSAGRYVAANPERAREFDFCARCMATFLHWLTPGSGLVAKSRSEIDEF